VVCIFMLYVRVCVVFVCSFGVSCLYVCVFVLYLCDIACLVYFCPGFVGVTYVLVAYCCV